MWKDRADYWIRVKALRTEWARGRTGNVINAIYNAAIKGNPLSQSLWMQIFEDYDPKGKKEEVKNKRPELSINDYRFLVEQLSDDKKNKYYNILTELIDDVNAITNAHDVELEPYQYGVFPERPLHQRFRN